MTLLAIEDLSKRYRAGETEVVAINNISLKIEPGAFVSIMGPSGSGKSTLMNVLGCLDTPTSGRYLLDGEDVSHLDRDQRAAIRNRRIGFVFQGFNLLPRMDALANVGLPLIYAKASGQTRRKAAQSALDIVGLSNRAHHLPTQLSGGEQQRVAVARALVNRPDVILADEPTGNLDSRTSSELLEVFGQLNRDRGITLVLVTHDEEVARITHRTILIRDGNIAEDMRQR